MSEAGELRQQLQAMHRRAQKAEGLLDRIYSEHHFAVGYVENNKGLFDYHSRRNWYAHYMMRNKVWSRIATHYQEKHISPMETPEQTLVKWVLRWINRRLGG